MKLKRVISLIIIFCFILTVSGISSYATSKISFSLKSPNVICIGETVQVGYSAKPALSKNQKIKWKSANNKIITVNTDGKITGVNFGTAKVTATLPNGQSSSINVKVEQYPVIVIHGILGSTMKENGSSTLVPNLNKTKPVPQDKLVVYDTFVAETGLSSLVPELNEKKISAYYCNYDWRLTIEEIAKLYLKPKIDQVLKETKKNKVIIISHSMGGLVSRYYIQNMGGASKVQALYMMAAPNSGAAMAYSITQLGQIPADLATTMIMQQFSMDLTGEDITAMTPDKKKAYINTNMPAYLELISTSNKLIQTTADKKYSNPYENKFLNNLNNKKYLSYYKAINAPSSQSGVYTATIYSTSNSATVTGFTQDNEKSSELIPVFGAGDGTVSIDSARCSDVFGSNWTYYSGKYGEHALIGSNQDVRQLLFKLLGVDEKKTSFQ